LKAGSLWEREKRRREGTCEMMWMMMMMMMGKLKHARFFIFFIK
jgi:hypothetical protein